MTPLVAGSTNQFLSQKFLLSMLIGRCSDKAPTVRAKALTCLGQFTSNENPQIALALQELFLQSPSPAGNQNKKVRLDLGGRVKGNGITTVGH